MCARIIPLRSSHCISRRIRHAVTVIELLIVLSIISILAALAMPALQSARERARMTVCTNNLHQLGIALKQYETVNKQLPASVTLGQTGGWAVEILPFVDLASDWLVLRSNPTGDALKRIQNYRPEVMTCVSRPNQRLRSISHFALNRDQEGSWTLFDAPMNIEYPWTSSLELPFDVTRSSVGPHHGGFLYTRGDAILLMMDGKSTEP